MAFQLVGSIPGEGLEDLRGKFVVVFILIENQAFKIGGFMRFACFCFIDPPVKSVA
jgi:hypothetical protein